MSVGSGVGVLKADRIRVVDGLRGIAVILVILYHAKIPTLETPGGFIGVDIFYVISGFVVCKSLQQSMDKGSFSFTEFYARRIVRLLPVLAVTLFLTSLVAFFLLYPFDLRDFFKSLISVNLLGANFWFWHTTADYFNPNSSYSPLIHTWSLAVEEQFYLIFPLALLIVHRYFKKFRVGIFFGLTVISLILTLLLAPKFPNASFYFTPFRAWEFGCGIVAYFLGKKFVSTHPLKPVFGHLIQKFIFLLFVFVGFRFSSLSTSIISIQLLVVLGTSLTLFFSTLCVVPVKGILSSRSLVSAGEMSYSAYLLHQPIFSFMMYQTNQVPTVSQLFAGLLATFSGAWLLQRMVERPIQNKLRSPTHFGWIITTWISISMLFISTSFLFVAKGWSAQKISPAQANILAFSKSENGLRMEWKSCFLGTNEMPDRFASFCGGTGTNSRILMLGDSHAAMIASSLLKKVPTMARYSAAGCAPTLDSKRITRGCYRINKLILNRVSTLQPNVILIANNWPDRAVNGSFPNNFKEEFRSFILLIRERSPRSKIFILGNTPEWAPNLPAVLVRNKVTLAKEQEIYTPQLSMLRKLDSQLMQIVNTTQVSFISYLPELCSVRSCLAVARFNKLTQPFLFDNSHTTLVGSEILAKRTYSAFKNFDPVSSF